MFIGKFFVVKPKRSGDERSPCGYSKKKIIQNLLSTRHLFCEGTPGRRELRESSMQQNRRPGGAMRPKASARGSGIDGKRGRLQHPRTKM